MKHIITSTVSQLEQKKKPNASQLVLQSADG